MTQFTKKAIINTFGEMLYEMPFDKITVSALVKRCGISPNTFYYHYSDIYELLECWMSDRMGVYALNSENGKWSDVVKKFLKACRNNSRTIYHIFESLSRDSLEKYLFSATNSAMYDFIAQRASGRSIPEKRLLEIAEICRYSFVGFFLKYLWNRMEEDVDSSVDSLSELLETFLTAVFDKYPIVD